MTRNLPGAQLRRRLMLSTALAGLGCLAASGAGAQALPTPGDVNSQFNSSEGAPAVVSNDPGLTTLQVDLNAQSTLINWNAFNVPDNKFANFSDTRVAGTGDIAVLNRDLNGVDPSQILGSLSSDANVTVYIVNPQGVIFGGNSNVSVGSLIASSLDLSATQQMAFLSGATGLQFNVGGGVGVTVNGSLTGTGTGGLGHVVLLGPTVTTGSTAVINGNGNVAIVAGTDITVVNPGSPLSFVINAGTPIPNAVMVDGMIKGKNVTFAVAGPGGLSDALLVSGTIEATTAVPTDTGIVLTAGVSLPGAGVTISAPSTTNVDGASATFKSGQDATFAAGGDLNLSPVDVAGDYAVTFATFSGSTLAPLLGTASDFTITDTSGPLAVGALSAPGTLSITALGGLLDVNGNLVSSLEAVALTSAAGINLNAAAIDSAGAQTLTGPMTLGADLTLTSSGSGNILLAGTVNGGQSLTANTAGTTTFGGAVGATTALTALTTNAGGTTAINGGSVTTTGAQIYNDAVSLGATTILSSTGGGAIQLGSTVDGAQALTVTTSGLTTFSGAVGGTTALASLLTDGNGTTAINGGSVTTTGAQTYNNSVSLGAATILSSTGGGAIQLGSTVDGAQALTVTTSGLTTFSGAVGGTTALASLLTDGNGTTAINGGSVTTTGAQTYNDAVSLGATTILSSTGGGAIQLGSTVDGAQALTVTTSGLTTFSGAVGGTTALASLLTDGNGTTAINGGSVTTTGAQTYNDAVSLGATTILSSTGGGAIQLGSTVDGAQALTVTTSGLTTFSGAVGGTTALASLLTDGNGTTAINGGSVTTTGAQTYNDSVSLGAATILSSTGGGAIQLGSTVDGAQALTVTTSGLTTFSGAVGGTTALASLLTDGGGTTAINGGSVTTTGAQTYNDAVTLGAATILSSAGGAILFNGTVDGSEDLTVTTSGTTRFAGAVGGTTALDSLTTDGGGTTAINGGSVTTTGAQTYNDAVTLGAATVLTGSTGTFSAGLNGLGNDLTLDFSGASTVDGSFVNIDDLVTGNGGTTTLTGSITTGGSQTYNDTILLAGGPVVLTSSGNAAIGFGSTVDGGEALTVTTSGTTTFSGAVGGATALASLLTNGGGGTAINGGSVTTTGAQTYTDSVTLGADARLYSTGGGALAFTSVDGPHILSLETTGAVTASGAIGGLDPLTALAIRAGTAGFGATNNVGTLAAQVAGGGLSFSNGQALTVGTVDGLVGIDTGPGSTMLDVAGLLTLSAGITAQGVSLKSIGLTQTAGTVVDAGSGLILIDADDGAIAMAGSLVTTNNGASAVRIIDSAAATLGNITTGAGATVTLGETGVDERGHPSLNTLGGNVAQTAAAAITTGTLIGNVGGTATLANDDNDIVTLGAFATGTGFAFTDADTLIVTGPVDAGTGDLTLRVRAGPLTIAGDLDAGGTVDLNALAGDIDQTGGAITAAQLTGSVSGLASLTSATNAIANLGNFSGLSPAAALVLRNSGALDIVGDVALDAGVDVETLAGDLVVASGGEVATTSGAIALKGAADLTVNGAVSSGSGPVGLSAGTGSIAVAGSVTSASGATNLTAPNAIAITSSGSVDSGSGTLSLAAGAGGIALAGTVATTSTLTLTSAAGIDQTGGLVSAGILTGSSTGATALDSSPNQIGTLGNFSADNFKLLDAAGLTVAGNVSGTTGVEISTSGTLAVANTASVGSTNAPIALTASGGGSDITLAGPVNSGTGTVALTAGRDISQSGLGVVTAGTLTGGSGGSTGLATLTNQIANLGPFSANGFALLDSGGLTVTGAVNGGAAGVGIETSGDLDVNAGVSATNAAIALTATTANSDIVLNAPVDAGTGVVTLLANGAGGTIGQTAPGAITAGTLTGSSSGATTLTAALNAVANLGAFSSTGFALRNDPALTVTGPVNAGPGALSLEVVGDSIAINGNLTASQVTVKATGVTQAAASTVNSGSGTILIDADDGAIDMAGSLVTTNAGAGAVRIVDSAAATLGNITTGAGGTVTLGESGLGALSGNVGQTAGTAIAAGTLIGNVGGSATLANAGNNVTTLGAFTAGTGFAFTDANTLVVAGPVNAGTGNLTLQVTTGPLTLAGNLDAPGGLVSLNALNGAIGQTGGRIRSASLTGRSVGGTTLNSAGNDVATLAGFTNTGAVGISFVDSRSLTITGPVDAGAGNLSLKAIGIGFPGQILTAGQDVTLEAQTGALAGATVVAGSNLTGTGASIDIGSATATAGTLSLTAGTGPLVLGTGTAGQNMALRASASSAQIGTANAAGNLTVDSTDLELLTAANAATARFTNLGSGPMRLGNGAAGGFNLTQAEVNRVSAGSVTFQSGARDVEIGALALANGVGSTQLAILTSGRIDVVGALSTAQTATTRTIQLGGTAVGTGQASVIAVNTSSGGRLLMGTPPTPANGSITGGSQLDLRGQRIGVGQTDLLTALGLVPGGSPASAADVASNYVGNAGSRLYNPSAPTNADVVTAYRLTVSYDQIALFQNTAVGGEPRGAALGSLGVAQILQLNSSGDGASNGFALFGRINDRGGAQAALLGPQVNVLNGANPNSTRINGCLVGSGGGGCLISSVTTPPINLFDQSQANIIRAANELPLSFDPVVGANNEALFSGFGSVDSIVTQPDCEEAADGKPCPANQEDEQ